MGDKIVQNMKHAPNEIVLDKIPDALVHTDKQLMDFIGYMNDCFEVK
jgi:hypothetical protein